MVAALTLLIVTPGAADGPPLGYQRIDVDAPFTASGGWAPAPGNRIGHHLAGSGDWTGLGTTTLNVEFSHFPFAPSPWPVSGTFTVSAADGTVDGTIAGALHHFSVEPNLVLELTVTGGAGRFSEATGSFDLQGRLRSPVPAQTSTLEATVTGQLTMPGTTPTTRADCREGGWRHFVDDEGKPFRSRGHCTAFVDRLP